MQRVYLEGFSEGSLINITSKNGDYSVKRKSIYYKLIRHRILVVLSLYKGGYGYNFIGPLPKLYEISSTSKFLLKHLLSRSAIYCFKTSKN